MTYEQETESKAWMRRRLQEVEEDITDLEPKFKALKAERRNLKLALGEKQTGRPRQRRPKVEPLEYAAAE